MPELLGLGLQTSELLRRKHRRPYNKKNYRCKIGPEYWTSITWNAFSRHPLHLHFWKWTSKF